MTRLELLDPTHDGDPRFDPRGEAGRRVRGAAIDRGRAAPPPRRSGRPLVLAAGAVAIAAAVALLLLPSGSSSSDARAALRDAVTQMQEIDSGRVVYRIGDTGSGEVRFQGGDLMWTDEGRVETGYLEIGDAAWARSDRGRYERVAPTADTDFPHSLVRQAGDQGLVELARRAPDLAEVAARGGERVYRATVTAGEVFDAAPIAGGRAEGGAWDREVRLEVTVAGSGLVRRVEVGVSGVPTVTEFLELGEDQALRPPSDP